MPEKTAFLLDLPVRVSDLQSMHGGKSLGHDVQWRQLAMSGLWGITAVLVFVYDLLDISIEPLSKILLIFAGTPEPRNPRIPSPNPSRKGRRY
ncbi:MAG: hypothetical protein JW932_01930 [Deltaproteobacteria bacterium]|nr:hypothetical protein [Deltaproteobacteria bacterium]